MYGERRGQAERVGGTGGGGYEHLVPSTVAEKLPSPCTLFQHEGEACFTTMLGGDVGEWRQSLTWGWSWSGEGKGWSWESVGWDLPGEERSHVKEGVLGGSGLLFSHPTILFLQQWVNLKK